MSPNYRVPEAEGQIKNFYVFLLLGKAAVDLYAAAWAAIRRTETAIRFVNVADG